MREIAPGKRFHEALRPIGVGDALPFRVRYENVHLVEIDGGRHQVTAHEHPHYEVIVVLAGLYHCRVNGFAATLGTGAIAILKPGDVHEDTGSDDVRFAAVHFQVLPGPTPERSANIFVDDIGPGTQQIAAPNAAFAPLAERLLAEAERIDPFTGHLLDALAAELVWAILRAVPRAVVNPRLLAGAEEHELGGRLTRLFAAHVSGNLGLHEMADALGMHQRTLSARCRSAFATSPTRMFVRFKMARAQTLLVQTDLPIKEISEHLGFENPYHFSTVFKRVHGVSPTQARAARG